MQEQDYFSELYEIAKHLNQEFTLGAALRKALAKTTEVLQVETGWIWLMEPNQRSVYLAASHNLPEALGDHPERLAGWCYCIKQYFEESIDKSLNISEIACTRLKDISVGTASLKYHATIPISADGKKIGLMNLLSKESRKLTERELTILNSISELVGSAVLRIRLQQQNILGKTQTASFETIANKVIQPRLAEIINSLEIKSPNRDNKQALQLASGLSSDIIELMSEQRDSNHHSTEVPATLYPATPLTKREIEVLTLIKNGHTNNQVGERLYISERTVKFHVSAILSKLHAKNRTEAVDIGMKRGFLE